MSFVEDKKDQFAGIARQLSALYEEKLDKSVPREDQIYSELSGLSQRYRDPKELARGSMKKVSRVFDVKTGCPVAFAELKSEAHVEMYEPFLREARLTALLDHPNIISVHDVGILPSGRPYFTMDLKRGDSLAEVIKKNKLPRSHLLEIYLKLCNAVAYAHSQNVLHLDLKPENIQVGRFGEVYVCDWGLGKIAGSCDSEDVEFDERPLNPDLLNHMTLCGELRGTPGFMAPEQFEKHGEKRFASDIYALGGILYAILTQHAPVTGSSDEIQEKTVAGKIASPTTAFPQKSISKSMNAVTMKALALKPQHRYQSVVELHDDVASFLSGYSTSAENAGFVKQFMLFFKRNLAACLVALWAMFAIVVATGFFIRQQQHNLEEVRLLHTLAELRREEAELASERYRVQLTHNKRFMRSLSGDLKTEAFELSRNLIYSDPVIALNLAVDRLMVRRKVGSKKNARSELGYTYFIMQRFDEADHYFNLSSVGNEDLMKVVQRYESQKPDALLTVELFVELIGALAEIGPSRWPMMEKMLAYDNAVREDHFGYDSVVEAVLRGWNPEWIDGEFLYNPARAILVIHGAGLQTWAMMTEDTSGESPLRFLDIEMLNARGTGLHDLNQLRGVPLQKLNIQDTPVKELAPLQEFRLLRELVVSRGQFSDEMLATLPDSVRVLIR